MKYRFEVGNNQNEMYLKVTYNGGKSYNFLFAEHVIEVATLKVLKKTTMLT
jgi:hypothetical protein